VIALAKDAPPLVIVSLSERELLGPWLYLMGNTWGNTDDTLLAQAELWETCGLEEKFRRYEGTEKKIGDLIDELDGTHVEYQLSKAAVDLLRAYLSRPQMPMRLGLACAGALRRMGR
jgi:hypothetical protein